MPDESDDMTTWRPGQWVQLHTGEPAIIVQLGPRWRYALEVRVATDHGGFLWTNRSMVTRRPDWDGQPDPLWLYRARHSTRPSLRLYYVLHPEAWHEDATTPEPARPAPMWEDEKEQSA